MIREQLEAHLATLNLPKKTENIQLLPESAALLKEYGLNVESASGSEDAKADRKVAD